MIGQLVHRAVHAISRNLTLLLTIAVVVGMVTTVIATVVTITEAKLQPVAFDPAMETVKANYVARNAALKSRLEGEGFVDPQFMRGQRYNDTLFCLRTDEGIKFCALREGGIETLSVLPTSNLPRAMTFHGQTVRLMGFANYLDLLSYDGGKTWSGSKLTMIARN